ncbi:hypothetical protein CGRA01v4_08775 [Colletotrichum graminicola]|nr:hypothetical protein CGRA01v4_08775 [Colletotrichum graminicola]
MSGLEWFLHWCLASRGKSSPSFYCYDDVVTHLRFTKKLASYWPGAKQSELVSRSRIVFHLTNLFNMIKCPVRAKSSYPLRVEHDDVSKMWMMGAN